MKVHFYGQTDPGCVRLNNEDAFVLQPLWDDSHLLCVVIDGLGGYEGGEYAAAIAADTIKCHLQENREGKLLELLKQSVVAANNAIVAAKAGHPDLSRMGCVLTATIIDLRKRQLNVVHIGDTRLYRISGGEMVKLTHDHSLVGYMEEMRQLTEQEAMSHPQRNVIDRYLGEESHQADDPHFIDSAIYPIYPGEKLLLCSDGLYDMLASAEILSTVSDDSQRMVQCLVDDAKDKGGLDNVTVVVVCIQDDMPSVKKSADGMLARVEVTETLPSDTGVPVQTAPLGQSGVQSRLWVICLLGGMMAGYALGNWNMTTSISELTDSLVTRELLADSLRNNLLTTPRDSLSCDSLAEDTLVNDTFNFETPPSTNN